MGGMISTRTLRIGDRERRLYLERLQSLYGKEIAGEQDLIPSQQFVIEQKRHQLNTGFVVGVSCPELSPKRLLISATQKCSFSCSHCWVFASPKATCSLDPKAFKAIFNNMPSDCLPQWTVTGGEFFLLPYWSDVLENFPIQCIYTNAFWGHPAENCKKYISDIGKALEKNPRIERKRFTLILSYDRYHIQGAGCQFPLATAVARIVDHLYESVPDVSVRISYTQDPADEEMVDPVIVELARDGYQISKTDISQKNNNIRTVSFSYSKRKGPTKELFVDMFPATPICRGLFLHPRRKREALSEETDQLSALDSLNGSRSYHQYAVGPDGGVALYETLYAPPVSFLLGNLIYEPWEQIEKRITCDPIAFTLKREGIGPILRFMKQFEPELLRNLAPDIQTIQQFLYLVFLNPLRRLLLNAFLLDELWGKYIFSCNKNHTIHQMKALLKTEHCPERERKILDFYGVG
jgi:hypothetical protein